MHPFIRIRTLFGDGVSVVQYHCGFRRRYVAIDWPIPDNKDHGFGKGYSIGPWSRATLRALRTDEHICGTKLSSSGMSMHTRHDATQLVPQSLWMCCLVDVVYMMITFTSSINASIRPGTTSRIDRRFCQLQSKGVLSSDFFVDNEVL